MLENSTEAGATPIELLIEEDLHRDKSGIFIRDNVRGMSQEIGHTVLHPFVTKPAARHVSLAYHSSAQQPKGMMAPWRSSGGQDKGRQSQPH